MNIECTMQWKLLRIRCKQIELMSVCVFGMFCTFIFASDIYVFFVVPTSSEQTPLCMRFLFNYDFYRVDDIRSFCLSHMRKWIILVKESDVARQGPSSVRSTHKQLWRDGREIWGGGEGSDVWISHHILRNTKYCSHVCEISLDFGSQSLFYSDAHSCTRVAQLAAVTHEIHIKIN